MVSIHHYGPVTARKRQRIPRVESEVRSTGAAVVYQQKFEWSEPVNRVPASGYDAVRYCDAPVANPVHRAAAAVIDFALVSVAVGLLMTSLYGLVGEEILNRGTLPYFGGLSAVCAFVYKLLWALAEADSPGLRWSHLKLLNFDGEEPTRRQRLIRLAAGSLSLLAAGLGLLWSLVDEESLSWHDHMSKTFLTAFPERGSRRSGGDN